MNDARQPQVRALRRGRIGTSLARSTPGRVALATGLAGLAVTAAISWTAARNNTDSEHRILQVQTRQAGDVVASAFLGIQNPLVTALQIASVTRGARLPFVHFMSSYTAPGNLFVSASLWKRSGSSLKPIATVGRAADLPPRSRAAQRFVRRAFGSAAVVVMGVPLNHLRGVGYAVAGAPGSSYAVYAERAIPANRQVPVESDSAFADLDYATYLGPKVSSSNLATTDVPPDTLPLRGYTVRDAIPFGDTTLTLVAAARGPLGGAFGGKLPWIFLVGGLLLTVATALVAAQLVTRRRESDDYARTVTGLYEQLDALYGEQRTIAEALQRALLPQVNPSIPDLEVETRYVAGTDGVDIGGDWYSVVLLDDRHFAFVVGDVSGRGIAAATVMARLRFTIRAYLIEGHSPELVLEMCSRQIDIETDDHFATVLVGIADVESRELTLANAGHLQPLVVSANGSEFIATDTGLPLGISPSSYASTSFLMPAGSTLVAFTDGLIERRDEGIDVSLQRLADQASAVSPTLDDLLTRLISEIRCDGPTDDIAVLAFRWRDPEPREPATSAASVVDTQPAR